MVGGGLRNSLSHCSGARRARIAVCGSFKDLPSFENGIWVSPVMVERERESKSFVYVKSYLIIW